MLQSQNNNDFEWKCNDCDKVVLSYDDLIKLRSKILLSFSEKLDKNGRAIITNLGVCAYKSVCSNCSASDTASITEHIELNNGAVYYPNTTDWNNFCIKYDNICNDEDFGACTDAYGKWIPFSKPQGHEWFHSGKYKNIPVCKYFKDNLVRDEATECKIEVDSSDDSKLSRDEPFSSI